MNKEGQPRYVKEKVAAAKAPKNRRRNNLIGLAVLGILIVICAVAVGMNFKAGTFAAGDGHHKEWSSGKPNVAVIHVDGEIKEEGDTYNQSWISSAIKDARLDRDNKAILLRIDSPGGTVYESDATWRALQTYKTKTKRPVYAYCEHLCASGGYYIASAADEIHADRNSLVGSIGVIGGLFIDATDLLDKLGVNVKAVHSGKNKLMGSIFEPASEEQLAIMQSVSDEAYEQFVGVVAEGRKKSPKEIKPLADGRIYSAKQAKEKGLIDGVSTYGELKKKVEKQLGIDKKLQFEDLEYEPPTSFADNFRLFKTYIDELKSITPGGDLQTTVETLEELNHGYPKYLYQG